MFDLRQFFGIWERCGNSSFWARKDPNPSGVHFFVDPIDAVAVMWDRYPHSGAGGIRVIMKRVPPQIPNEIFDAAVKQLPRHMSEEYADFMILLTMMAALGFDKGAMLRAFVKYRKEQGETYRREGRDFQEPAREEILMATLKTLGNLGEHAISEIRHVLPDEIDETLADFGVVECPEMEASR